MIGDGSHCSLIQTGFFPDLFITTRGKGSVQVKKMECDICKVQTETGNCALHSVKVRGGLTENTASIK